MATNSRRIPDSKNILPYGEESLGLDVMRVTMEMVRYSDEWENLQALLPMGMQTSLQMARGHSLRHEL